VDAALASLLVKGGLEPFQKSGGRLMIRKKSESCQDTAKMGTTFGAIPATMFGVVVGTIICYIRLFRGFCVWSLLHDHTVVVCPATREISELSTNRPKCVICLSDKLIQRTPVRAFDGSAALLTVKTGSGFDFVQA